MKKSSRPLKNSESQSRRRSLAKSFDARRLSTAVRATRSCESSSHTYEGEPAYTWKTRITECLQMTGGQ